MEEPAEGPTSMSGDFGRMQPLSLPFEDPS
jgi:hypothetical protein